MKAAPDTPISGDTYRLSAYDLGLAPYETIQDLQTRLRRAVSDGAASEALLLLEHEPVITLGAHASPTDILDTQRAQQMDVSVVRSERGGQSTVHGPGQLISYPVINIPRRDLRTYVHDLEEVLLLLLADLGLQAKRLERRPGLYLDGLKIASLGLRCEHGVASHGSALNVNVDLSLFDLIVSCGDPGLHQTSIQQATGQTYEMPEIKDRYIEAFRQVFADALPPLSSLTKVDVDALWSLVATSGAEDC